jgi:hypothetical protein
LQEALSKDGDFLKEMVRMLLQEMMEEERNTQVGVLSQQGVISPGLLIPG